MSTTKAKKAPKPAAETPPAPRPRPRKPRRPTEAQRRAKAVAELDAALAARTAHVTPGERAEARRLAAGRVAARDYWQRHCHELAMTVSELMADRHFAEVMDTVNVLAALCRGGASDLGVRSREIDEFALAVGVDPSDFWAIALPANP